MTLHVTCVAGSSSLKLKGNPTVSAGPKHSLGVCP
jgi:hypothetical protein